MRTKNEKHKIEQQCKHYFSNHILSIDNPNNQIEEPCNTNLLSILTQSNSEQRRNKNFSFASW